VRSSPTRGDVRLSLRLRGVIHEIESYMRSSPMRDDVRLSLRLRGVLHLICKILDNGGLT